MPVTDAEIARMPHHVRHRDLITPNFSLGEFDCRSGFAYPQEWIPTRLRPLCVALEAIRKDAGVPLVVRSGYRTEAYNARLSGASPRSQHVQGRAADIAPMCFGRHEREERLDRMVRFINVHHFSLGISALGQYVERGFLHVDVRPVPVGDNRLRQWEG